jgi:hypothetical protein
MSDGRRKDDSQPSFSEMPTVVHRRKPKRGEQRTEQREPRALPAGAEHTVRIKRERVERRALPFRKDARGRRATDRAEQSQTGEVRPAELGPALPFAAAPASQPPASQPPASQPPASQPPELQKPSVWTATAAIDRRALPSSYAPAAADEAPPTARPTPLGSELHLVVGIAVAAVAIILAIALIASC